MTLVKCESYSYKQYLSKRLNVYDINSTFVVYLCTEVSKVQV